MEKNVRLMTRVEGHSEIITYRDRKKRLSIEFSMPMFRDIENFLVGRRIEDVPRTVARICGLCPVSHELACCKALESILHVEPPRTAKMLRLLMLLAELMRSHLINFAFMTLPDLYSFAISPKRTDIIGVSELNPKEFRKVLSLVQTADEILNILGGRAVHPVYPVVGGVAKPLSKEDRDELHRIVEGAVKSSSWILSLCNKLLKDVEDLKAFNLSNRFHYLTSFEMNEDLYFYGGDMKIASDQGKIVEDFKPNNFSSYIKNIKWSGGQFKFLHSTNRGIEHPLMTGPQARAMVRKTEVFRESGVDSKNILFLNLFRLEEVSFCIYRCLGLLEDSQITSSDVQANFSYAEGSNCGAVEAPRGTLIHQYRINSRGEIESARIITPTNVKAYGIGIAISELLKTFSEMNLPENDVVEKIKMAIRSFDPCISCATHTKNQ